MSEEYDPWEEIEYYLAGDLVAEQMARRDMAKHPPSARERRRDRRLEERLDSIRVRKGVSAKKIFIMVLIANMVALIIDPTLLFMTLPLSMTLTTILALTSRSGRPKRKPRRLGRRWR